MKVLDKFETLRSKAKDTLVIVQDQETIQNSGVRKFILNVRFFVFRKENSLTYPRNSTTDFGLLFGSTDISVCCFIGRIHAVSFQFK